MRRQPAIRRLTAHDLRLIAQIDRSEHVRVEYAVFDGGLVERPVSMTRISNWDVEGSGPYSVAAQLAFCEPLVSEGAAFLGAFAEDEPLGLAVVHPAFEPSMAWLAFLYVSRPHRRRGVASTLWEAASDVAVSSMAASMYVAAVPTGSAVGFYLSRGCQLADPPHPTLHAREPDDIHFVCHLR